MRLSIHRLRCPVAAAALIVLAATGCVSSHAKDGLPELDVEDPDPSKDTDAPKFCNPAGKQGADLDKCYAFNESLYKEFDEEAKKRQPWFNFTPDSWVESPELEGKYVQPVTPAAEKDAVARLESKPWVELQPAEAQALTGQAAAFPGLKPYLVRGLYYYRENGAFTVFEKSQSILVRHDSVGAETTDEKRTGVVVHLAAPPREVYVDCGVTD